MATPTINKHKRVDSAVDGIDTVSSTLTTAQNLCTAIALLASDKGIRALADLADTVTHQNRALEDRDNQVKSLTANLSTQHESHSTSTQEQLSQFEKRYDSWKAEQTQLQNQIKTLTVAYEEKASEANTLQAKVEEFTRKIEDFETEHSQTTKRLKEKDQIIGQLEARLKTEQAKSNEYLGTLNKAQGQQVTLQKHFEVEKSQHQALRKEATKTEERLSILMQLSARMKDLKLPEV